MRTILFVLGSLFIILPKAMAFGDRPIPAPVASPTPAPATPAYNAPANTKNQCSAPNPNAKLLFAAIDASDASQVTQILQNDIIAVDALNEKCERALAMSIRKRDLNVFSIVNNFYSAIRPLDYKATLENGYSYSQYAAKYGSLPIVTALEAQAPTKNSDEKNTALYLATMSNSSDVVDFFVQNGADPSLKDQSGLNLLLVAAGNPLDGVNLVDFFLHKGVDVNSRDSRGETALMLAAENPSGTDLVSFLLKSGATVNAISNMNQSAIFYAADGANFATAKVLLAAGADLSLLDSSGNTVFIHAVESPRASLDLVQELIRDGVEIRAADVLPYAIGSGSPNALAITKLLVQAGAVVNGKGALSFAVNTGSSAMVSFLLSVGADANEIYQSNSPLILAVINDATDTLAITKVLLQAGANVNAASSDYLHTTVLMQAAAKDSIDVIQLLLRSGASISAADDNGKTAYDYAVFFNRDSAILKLLKP